MRSRSFYGAGNASQSILLDEVRCSGSENNIFYCSHDALGSNDCQHNEDVGVLCTGSTAGEYADRRVRTRSLGAQIDEYVHSRWVRRSMSMSVTGCADRRVRTQSLCAQIDKYVSLRVLRSTSTSVAGYADRRVRQGDEHVNRWVHRSTSVSVGGCEDNNNNNR